MSEPTTAPIERPDPTLDSHQAIRLDEAVLCMDCDVISNVVRHECPACGGRQRFPIQRWINRGTR